jgi:hypothetical protein
MLDAKDILQLVAGNAAAMSYLDSGPCVLEHVSQRAADGPDVRLDACPCERTAEPPDPRTDDPAEKVRELGGGQYVSSERHTIGDLVRNALGNG